MTDNAKAIRRQSDDKGEIYSRATATIMSDDHPDRARQEFKAETDVNYQLRRFGVGRPLKFGEADYTIDLQGALTAIAAARRAHSKLPKEVRDKYPSWRDMLSAVENGELNSELLKPKPPAPAVEPPPKPADNE